MICQIIKNRIFVNLKIKEIFKFICSFVLFLSLIACNNDSKKEIIKSRDSILNIQKIAILDQLKDIYNTSGILKKLEICKAKLKYRKYNKKNKKTIKESIFNIFPSEQFLRIGEKHDSVAKWYVSKKIKNTKILRIASYADNNYFNKFDERTTFIFEKERHIESHGLSKYYISFILKGSYWIEGIYGTTNLLLIQYIPIGISIAITRIKILDFKQRKLFFYKTQERTGELYSFAQANKDGTKVFLILDEPETLAKLLDLKTGRLVKLKCHGNKNIIKLDEIGKNEITLSWKNSTTIIIRNSKINGNLKCFIKI